MHSHNLSYVEGFVCSSFCYISYVEAVKFKLKTWIIDIALSQSQFLIAYAHAGEKHESQTVGFATELHAKADNCSFSDVG